MTLFERDWTGDKSRVLPIVVDGAEWVVDGQGVATRKRDGMATMVEGAWLYKRYDAKHGKTPPPNFRPAQEPDGQTGHWPGWVPVNRAGPADWMFSLAPWPTSDGTYEFCGPRIGANPEHLTEYTFFRHGDERLPDAPRDFSGLAAFFALTCIEGIVWHHPDGRMVKIKRRDFGLPWPIQERHGARS